MGKIKGIEITDLRVGIGTEATQDSCVAVKVRMFLRRGDEVSYSPAFGPRMVIDLSRRDCIAGLLKGIPGIRVGGLRQIVISPHLAYGKAGIPGRIPANALLRCEVELIAIREHSALLPEDYLPGRLLSVSHPGNSTDRNSNWTIQIHENGNSSLYFSLPGPKSPLWSQVPIRLDPSEADSLIQLALDTPTELPDDCILWGSDKLDIPKGNRPVRDKATQTPCIVVNITDRNERILDYAVPETSDLFLRSPLFNAVSEVITPHLGPPIESSPQS